MPMPYSGPVGNLVLETANAPGTAAAFTLGGAPSGWMGYVAAFGTGKTAFYFGTDGVQAEWGTGLVTAGSLNTLSRGVAGNSQGTTQRLNFTGAVQVYNSIPAEWQPYFDVSNGTLPMGGRRLAGLGAGVVADDGARLGQVAWRVLQDTAVSSAVAAVAFTLPAGFSRFRVELSNVLPSTPAAVYMRLSLDNGATFEAAASSYLTAGADIRPSGLAATTAPGNYVDIAPSAANQFSGWVEFESGAAGGAKNLLYDTVNPNSGASVRRAGGGYCGFSGTATTVLFGTTAGGIAAGRLRLLGAF